MIKAQAEGRTPKAAPPSLDSGGDPQDVGSVDGGMDAESRPPAPSMGIGLGLDMRKDTITKRKAFKERFAEGSIFIFP